MRAALFASLLLFMLTLSLDPAAAGASPPFTSGVLNFTLSNPTSIAFGPDGRLYAASQTDIRALTLDQGGLHVAAVETIATGQDELIGIAFDPTAPSPVKIYASRREPSATDGYEGRVSTYSAPSWTRQDIITGLPNSTPHTNHFTNGLAFDVSGKLYIAQGSDTDAGLQGPNYPETPLSAAILRADIHAPSFDGNVTYSPASTPADDNVDQTGGTVEVYAPGTRNPYDLVVHTNGNIYATDNGPQGPSTSTSCTTDGTGVSSADELNMIVQGNYYGFPNRNRGRSDVRQCTYHAPEEGNGAGFTAPIFIFPAHCSCDGIAEYKSNAFGGTLQGDLVVAQLILGNVVRADLSPEGQSVSSVTTLQSGYNLPLDVAVSPNGTIYIAEFGANQISYLTPAAVGGLTELPSPAAAPPSSQRTWAWLALLPLLVLLLATQRGLRRKHGGG
jgi:glucose/arabinose dehydrogenase